MRLRHPNVILFMGVTVSPPSIVAEFMARGSLYSIILTPDLAIPTLAVFRMQYLAASGVVHGDLRSLNVMGAAGAVAARDGGGARGWRADGARRVVESELRGCEVVAKVLLELRKRHSSCCRWRCAWRRR